MTDQLFNAFNLPASSPQLTEREIYMLAATAAAEAARWYQPSHRSYQMYMVLSDILDARDGEFTAAEHDAARAKLLGN